MRNLSRREFLCTSAAATAISAPGAWASPRPNETIRIAVTGVRGRGGDHVKGLLGVPDVQVTAICDVNSKVIDKSMKAVEDKEGKNPAYFHDFRKLSEHNTA